MKKVVLIISLVFVAFLCRAQNNYFYVSWDINQPLSSTDFIDHTSSSGLKAGFRIFPEDNERFAVGLDVNWGAYDEYVPRTTMQTSDGHITTDYFNYIYTLGIAATGQYYFDCGDIDWLYPYAGLGLGANNNHYVMYYNIYREEDTQWGFLVRPEAGVILRFSRSVGALVAVHYDYSTNKSDYFDYDNFSALGFQVGLTFMNRR